jgi:hypothetical protein
MTVNDRRDGNTQSAHTDRMSSEPSLMASSTTPDRRTKNKPPTGLSMSETAALFTSIVGEPWKEATDEMQAMFRFLVSRNQIDLLRERVGEAAAKDCISQALNVATMYGKCLRALVRRGSDVCEYDPGNTRSPYQEFISINTNWIDRDNCPTIFNMKPDLAPLMWYQEDSSKVCYLIAIFYRQSLDSGVSSVGLYALNLDQFMRNYFSDDDIYKTVFGLVGGFPMKMLKLMLEKQNPNAHSVAGYQSLFLEEFSANQVFKHIKCLLARHGSLIIEMPAQNEVTFHGLLVMTTTFDDFDPSLYERMDAKTCRYRKS